MKKLFLASVFALATLTACNNDELINYPSSQKEEVSKNLARSDDEQSTEIPEGYTENPTDDNAIEAIKVIEEDYSTDSNTSGKIICHTPYNTWNGNACVRSGGHLFIVMWQIAPTLVFDNNGNHHWEIQQHYYVSEPLQSCKCGS